MPEVVLSSTGIGTLLITRDKGATNTPAAPVSMGMFTQHSL